MRPFVKSEHSDENLLKQHLECVFLQKDRLKCCLETTRNRCPCATKSYIAPTPFCL